MIKSRSFYIAGFGAIVFLVLLLLLARRVLPSEPRPHAIEPVRWPPLQGSSGHKDSERKTWTNTDWSQFAYVQYVTNLPYLCNSIMLFESLQRLGCKPDKLMMYPFEFSLEDESTEARILRKARDEYNVILKPIKIQRRANNDPTWAESYTKLLAFNQTNYKRVLHLDSDSTVLQSMDELFLLEPAWVAMPRAYWLGFKGRILSSQLLLLQPSEYEFDRVMKATNDAGDKDYDMDILNNLYQDSAMILPHRRYDLLTGEFRGDDHQKYLQDDQQQWDPEAIMKEAKYIHFSDWPLPKPWLAKPEAVDKSKPSCGQLSVTNQTEDCRDRDIWVGIYADFRRRRREICGLEV